jgi:Holliday junction resolvase RusA-like endonuclease
MSKITLPLPPSVNELYRYTCRGQFPHMYITPEGKAWFEEAGWTIKAKWRGKTITAPCEIWIQLYISHQRDADNVLKATLDVLQKNGVVKNDNLFYKIDIEKFKVKKGEERVEVEMLGY